MFETKLPSGAEGRVVRVCVRRLRFPGNAQLLVPGKLTDHLAVLVCEYGHPNITNAAACSQVGIVFTITLTYLGFVLLAIGSLWNADILSKIRKLRKQCQKLREMQERKKARKEAGLEETLLPVSEPKSNAPKPAEEEEDCET